MDASPILSFDTLHHTISAIEAVSAFKKLTAEETQLEDPAISRIPSAAGDSPKTRP